MKLNLKTQHRIPLGLYALPRANLILLVALIFSTCNSHLFSQESPLPAIDFVKLDKEDGLLNDSYNYFIYKDRVGYLWVSSVQGVYKYDGYRFKFFTDQGEEKGMIGTNVQSDFYEDEGGNIWFTTFRGLNKYDCSSDKVLGYTLSNKAGKQINADYHIFHIDTINHELYLTADKIIYKYDYLKNEIIESLPQTVQSFRFSVQIDAKGRVTKIYGTPWVMNNGIEVMNFNDTSNTWSYRYKSFEDELGDNKISDILYTNDRAWLVSDIGLIELDAEDEIENVFTFKPTFGKMFFKAEMLDEERILLSTNDDGFYIYETNERVLFPINATVESEKIDYTCYLYLDRDNTLWTGLNAGGIGRYDLKKQSLLEKSKRIYTGKKIKKIIQEKQVYLLNKNNTLTIIDGIANHKVLNTYHFDIDVRDFVVNAQGDVLIIDQNAIYSLETNTGVLKQEQKVNFDLIRISRIQDKCLVSTHKGIYIWNNNEKEIEALHYSDKEKYKNKSITGTLFSNDFECLMAYEGEKIHIASIYDNSISVNRETSFSGFIYDAIPVKSDWFFACVNGLFRIDEVGGLHKLKYQNYLPEMGFNSLVLSKENVLILGNSEGLYSYDLSSSTLQKINYLVEDKLTVIPHGLRYTINDNLMVSSEEAVYLISEEAFQEIIEGPILKVKSLEINNRLTAGSNLLNQANSKIELSYNDKYFGLELQSLDKNLGGNGMIRYKDSRTDHWQNLVNGKLSFENLTPGDFELSFVALDKNLNSSDVKSIYVKVKEPFFKTSAFYLLLGLIMAVLSYLTGKIIEKVNSDKLRRELVLQLAKEQERNRIASMIHDDMGAILSTIQFTSEDLSMDIVDTELKQKANSIQNDAKDLISRMRTNIWALKTETKTLLELCRELKKSAFDQVSMLGMHLEFPLEENLPRIQLAGATCMEIMLIQKESLNNIVKHANAKNIFINPSFCNGNFVLKIQDDGNGIPENYNPGMGLTNMNKRAKAISGDLKMLNSLDGLTVHLVVPLQIGN